MSVDRMRPRGLWTHSGVAARRRGFSLMDLLVSVAVMGVLIGLLLPTLGGAMEMARRVRCQANLNQVGLALAMYADAHSGQLPGSIFSQTTVRGAGGGNVVRAQPQNTIFVRRAEGERSIHPDGWDGLGLLTLGGVGAYLSNPEVLYCPSHRGEHGYNEYRGHWSTEEGQIAGNYQYRLPPNYTFMDQLDPGLTLVSDGIRSKNDYNHRVGNNMLKADLSIFWYSDTDGTLLSSLADNGDEYLARVAVSDAWHTLDTDPQHPVGSGSSGNKAPGGRFTAGLMK